MKLMKVLEPITERNLAKLRPGEWIWDNKRVRKQAHEIGSFRAKYIIEPIGFRQVHVLNEENISKKRLHRVFMLSDMYKGGNTWMDFEEDRFYRIKWEMISTLGGDGKQKEIIGNL